MMRPGLLKAAISVLMIGAATSLPAAYADEAVEVGAYKDYEHMKPFRALAGRLLRGEGVGPNGQPIVDIAKWEFVLGGRAFQSTHRLSDGTYGGKTIIFYDEGAKEYIFHYFTTAGFHTTGKLELTPGGFESIEKVIGHDEFAEVRASVIVSDEDVRVVSHHVKLNGEVGPAEEMIYRPHDGPAPSFLAGAARAEMKAK